VNLPAELKFSRPRYQAITGDALRLVTSDDGGALLRVIAGSVGGFEGPGITFTPITYLHATVAPGARLVLPWRPDFSAFAYSLVGQGYAGPEQRPLQDHQLGVFGPGDGVVLRAADRQRGGTTGWEVLVLGGLPLREPIASYGPFVMNTREQLIQAVEDYEAGRLGTIPADQVAPRDFS
jgi:quercetin 2,3-dioxygenase